MFSDSEEEGPWLGSEDSSYAELLKANYRVLRDIGEGGFAEVKLAKHLLTQSLVAIKIIPKTRNNEILTTEMDLMSSLDHPNVIKLYEIIETDDLVYLVLEYAKGGDLQALVDTVGCLWEGEARSLFRQIANAMCYCHKMGIAHRDLKLDNILLDAQSKPKICDFGLGVRCQEGKRLQTACGTLPFCAPEILTHTKYDGPKADIWSLGVVLYNLVVGRPPFRGITVMQIEKAVLQGEFDFPAHVSGDFRDLIRAMVAVDPERRPSLEHVLEHPWLREGQPEPPEPQGLPPRPDLSILDAMAVMDYDPQQVREALSARSYNGLMGTYLMLEQKKSESVDPSSWLRPLRPATVTTGASSLRVSTARDTGPGRHSSTFLGEDQKGSARPHYLAMTLGVLPTKSPHPRPVPTLNTVVAREDSQPQEVPEASQDLLSKEPSSVPESGDSRVWTRLRRCLKWLQGLCCCLLFRKKECGNKVVPMEDKDSTESLESS